MTPDEVRKAARLALDWLGLADRYEFEFSRRTRAYGDCEHGPRAGGRIRVSLPWVLAGAPEGEIHQTILHECAHALAGLGCGHGPAWKSWAIRLGVPPVACRVSATPIPTKYVLVCPECGPVEGRSRKPTRQLVHKRCRNTVIAELRTR